MPRSTKGEGRKPLLSFLLNLLAKYIIHKCGPLNYREMVVSLYHMGMKKDSTVTVSSSGKTVKFPKGTTHLVGGFLSTLRASPKVMDAGLSISNDTFYRDSRTRFPSVLVTSSTYFYSRGGQVVSLPRRKLRVVTGGPALFIYNAQ